MSADDTDKILDWNDNRDEQTYAIIGAAMEVHRRLGPGFVELVYQEAFTRELTVRHIPFQTEVRFKVVYREQPLDCLYSSASSAFVCVICGSKRKNLKE